MNTDYQDIKSYKNQIFVEICENLCPTFNYSNCARVRNKRMPKVT